MLLTAALSVQPLGPLTVAALVAVVLLLAASAALSSVELALPALDPAQQHRLKDEGRSGAWALDLLADPRGSLVTIRIANLAAIVGAVALTVLALPGYLATAVGILVVAFLLLIVNEMVPKVTAATDPVRVVLSMAGPLVLLRGTLRPLSAALIRGTAFIERRTLRRNGLSAGEPDHAGEPAPDGGDADERRMLRGIVRFGDIEAKQAMRPRTEVVAFDQAMGFRELLAAIVESGFSRIPVHEGTLDRIKGILHIKDVLPHIYEDDFRWHTLLRAPYFVPESKKLDDLLKEFQEQRVHLAVVVDEYGGTSGIITLEDVIEEIVGDITDEHDEKEPVHSQVDEHTWVFEGRVPLTDMYRILDIDGGPFEERKGDSGTLGGFIMELTGRIPKKGEEVAFQPYTFVVEASDNKRVRRVRMTRDDG